MFMSGMPVYFDTFLTERKQVSFPKTKKKRIRKKWAKRPTNWRETPKKEIWRVGDAWVVHPAYWPEFCRAAGIQVVENPRDLLEARLPPATPTRKPWDHLFELPALSVPRGFVHSAY